MLLRFPAVDIMSHKYFATVRDDPEFNPMVEVYRHFDAMLGELITELDEDDTLIMSLTTESKTASCIISNACWCLMDRACLRIRLCPPCRLGIYRV